MSNECPFCNVRETQVLVQSEYGAAISDAYPICDGHTLIVPRQHVASIFDLYSDEQDDLWRLVAEVRALLTERLQPDGLNIGINDGTATAGQLNMLISMSFLVT